MCGTGLILGWNARGSTMLAHEFADNSGSVFFDDGSGETVVISLTLSDVRDQLKNPTSVLHQSATSNMLTLIHKLLESLP